LNIDRRMIAMGAVYQKNDINELIKCHKLWSNPLLKMFTENTIELPDCALFFSQYSFYSSNFTRILATALAKCSDETARSIIVSNLWEEVGEKNLMSSHSRLFVNFLRGIGVQESPIQYLPITKYFVNSYLSLCTNSSFKEVLAILAYATEGIVAELYNIFIQGLSSCGVSEQHLTFFVEHIHCDHGHAKALEDALQWQSLDETCQQSCIKAINIALNLRDEFFTEIYKEIYGKRFSPILKGLLANGNDQAALKYDSIVSFEDQLTDSLLYENKSCEQSVNFSVKRFAIQGRVLDPRLLIIPAKCKNEYHKHAHEAFFYVISGMGQVRIGDEVQDIRGGSYVYIPRWVSHQTINIGNDNLKILAMTDYNLTKYFPKNSETSYRQKNLELVKLEGSEMTDE
ncbi:iron-containing redox enzyme family protein, partial [Fangia hongkongensis]|uniref:iron-containing redox enzyme family protein n=2 Tax=Fangia hongkongensis TaxID=270495 RepID=UPI001F48FCC3